MFELSNNIYFVVHKLYYVDQNDDQETRAGPINRDGGSTSFLTRILRLYFLVQLI
jgi:hypothetical protein